MASYPELFELQHESPLKNKVVVACYIAANGIMTATEPLPANQAQRLVWARSVFLDEDTQADRMLWAVLVANIAQDADTIKGASDATVQANVNAHIDLFAGS